MKTSPAQCMRNCCPPRGPRGLSNMKSQTSPGRGRNQESGVRSQESATLTPDSCLLTPVSCLLPPASACQHNINYWRGGSYYGLGPSAAGYVRGIRTKNWSNTQLYCEELARGRRAIESHEELSPGGMRENECTRR